MSPCIMADAPFKRHFHLVGFANCLWLLAIRCLKSITLAAPAFLRPIQFDLQLLQETRGTEHTWRYPHATRRSPSQGGQWCEHPLRASSSMCAVVVLLGSFLSVDTLQADRTRYETWKSPSLIPLSWSRTEDM